MKHPTLLEHQREAVSILQERLLRWGGAVLADPLGSGKSYVASALGVDWMKRGGEVTLIIPAILRSQWSVVLRAFELDPPILTHDQLRHRLIIPGVSAGSLLIVDEAHRFRNPSTQRHAALARLAVGARVLLLTASPFWNALSDIEALLALFAADDLFRAIGVLSLERAFVEKGEAMRSVVRQVVLRRFEVRQRLHASLPAYSIRQLQYGMPNEQRDLLGRAAALRLPGVSPEARALVSTMWEHRLLSSVRAFGESLERQRRYTAEALRLAQEGHELRRPSFRRLFPKEARPVQHLLFPGCWLAPGGTDPSELQSDLVLLGDLLHELGRIEEDQKLALLQRELAFISRPILLFTEFVATAVYVFNAVRHLLRTAVATSRVSRDSLDRESEAAVELERFRGGETELLIVTDLASEGLDLQIARAVVHYDLAWNRVRLRQRNGRIRRLGSSHQTVEVLYFVPGESALDRLTLLRWKQREEALLEGDPGPVRESLDGCCPPAWLPRSSAQWKLFGRMERLRLLDQPLRRLLTRRYRIGVERLMDELIGEHLDETRASWLSDLLESEMLIQRGSWKRSEPLDSIVEANG